MTTRGAIPPSIKDALESEHGYVVTITGMPGTGKSLLVNEIFREFDNSFIVLSQSEASSQLLHALLAAPDWDSRHIITHFWRRPDYDEIQKLSLKEQMIQLLGQSPEADFDILIIDSWTSFLLPIEPARQNEIQQAITYSARSERKKLVLVVDGHPKAALDDDLPLFSSSDAIVNLQRFRQDQRMYRELNIEKLRGRQVSQDMFLFTLNGGRFTYLPWHVHKFPPITIETDPIEDPSPEHVSTGNKSLDQILGGGFRKRGLSLIEVESLAAPYLETIYIPFLSNYLQLGRPAVVLLPEGWSPERFIRGIGHFVDVDVVRERVIFFGRQVFGTAKNVRAISDDPFKTLQEIRYESAQLEKKFNATPTELFALNTLENKYGPTMVKGMMAELTAVLPESERAVVAILSSQQELESGSISHSIHLRVKELCGVLSVCGVTPRTNFLAVRPILSRGSLDYELVPIE
ncbi:MAG: hypothetical protein DRP09_11305 [Candidatus Thorarchaeota archaeon]|nr:MAG: hypothetical protein DRP09_11305 [Candidatus Thorarchaeota archaeon]